MKRIETKSKCYSLFEKGIFGNKALTWNSYEEMINSSWKGLISIRSKKGILRSQTRFNILKEKVKEEMEKMKMENIKIEDITFNQSMPDNHLLIQGEIMLTERGLYLLYTTVKKPMNQGLAEQTLHAFGLNAKMILEKNLYTSSLADIYALLEIYPDSVIEFSSYSIPVGNIKGRNAVIWEVRNY